MEAAKRVAKNTGILYARMAITVFISLYSTRLILAALGVADFGLFNVVGGVISMLGFLNTSMAAATQRFMSFAQGAGDLEKVKRIFNMSSLLHWGIAILVLLLLESAGYFFFHGILNIAPDRIEVAKLIYQFMVISTVFTVISVPYEAVITSHENMMVYAILGVFEAVLKLGIAFYITHTVFDHLVMYGVLMAALSVLLLIIKRIYCHRVYEECYLNVMRYSDKPLLKEMARFAGWSLLGNSSSALSAYGQGILLNIFFGTIVNAAQGIANQVSGILGVLAGSLQKSIFPTLGKNEGASNRDVLIKSTYWGSKISFYLLLITFIPILIEMEFILKIWLKNVPTFAIIFCRLLLIRNLIEQFYTTIVISINVVGDIKLFQILHSILNIANLLLVYVLFRNGLSATFLYYAFIFHSLLMLTFTLIYAKVTFNFKSKLFIKNVVINSLASFFIVFCLSLFPFLFSQGLIRIILVTVISSISTLVCFWRIGNDKIERHNLQSALFDFLKYKVFA